MIQGRLAGTDGFAGNTFTRQQRPQAGLPRPPVRGRAVAPAARRLLQRAPGADRRQRPGRRQRSLPGARRLGRDAQPRQPRGDSVRRFARQVSGPRRAAFTTPFDVSDPVNTPVRARHRRTRTVGPALADAVTDLQRRGDPARRAARRLPVRAARAPRRSRSTAARAARASSTRSRTSGIRPRATPTSPHGSSFMMVDRVRPEGEVPEGPLDPHLLGVGEPELEALRRPDPDVLAEEVGRPALLRRPGEADREERSGGSRQVGRSCDAARSRPTAPPGGVGMRPLIPPVRGPVCVGGEGGGGWRRYAQVRRIP